MKPKVQFDPELGISMRRSYWPIRSAGQLMIVVALSGLTFWVMPMGWGGPATGSRGVRRAPVRRAAIRQPLQTPRAGAAPSSDRFVIMAAPEIDPAMVIRADPDIDAAMVVHPSGADGRATRVAPSIGWPPSQGPQPDALTVPGWPNSWYSPVPAVPQP